jgi:CubicO group peptidase (beta-lactamase class C family)
MQNLSIHLLALASFSILPLQAEPLSPKQVETAAENLLANARKELKDTGIPGMALAVIFEDKVLLAEGLGVREVGTDRAVDTNTVFQMASVSKPIGSTVVAALVGQGVIGWDARIADLDPSFAMPDPWVTKEIQIRDMYSHRSGLPSHAGDLLEDMGYSREEILHRLRFQPPEGSFRAHYAYTNFGLTAAAGAAAKAAGKDWATLSEDLLYKPLGMTSTSSRFSDFEKHPNHALGHELVEGKWGHRTQRQPDAQSPAGGVSSSVNDLIKWMQLQLNGGKFEGKVLIEATALEETHRPQVLTGSRKDTGLPTFYGLGWDTRHDEAGRLRLSHSGAFSLGAATYVALLPEQKLGIVILSNGAPIGVPEGLGNTFLDEAITGSASQDWMKVFKSIFAKMAEEERSQLPKNPPKNATPPASPDTYQGTYASEFFGPVEVTTTDSGLTLALGPKPHLHPLTPWNRDTFTYEPVGENANGPSAVTFSLGPNGKADRMTIENLDAHGLGTFLRIPPSTP